mgnify:FL=1
MFSKFWSFVCTQRDSMSHPRSPVQPTVSRVENCNTREFQKAGNPNKALRIEEREDQSSCLEPFLHTRFQYLTSLCALTSSRLNQTTIGWSRPNFVSESQQIYILPVWSSLQYLIPVLGICFTSLEMKPRSWPFFGLRGRLSDTDSVLTLSLHKGYLNLTYHHTKVSEII